MTLIISDLVRTMSTYLRIGDVRVKDASGVIEARDASDTAYVDVSLNRIQVHGDNAANAVIFDAPAGLGGDVTFTLPSALGSTGQFIVQTDGAGTLGFANGVSNGNLTQIEEFTEGTSSPLTVFASPPDDAELMQVIIEVTAAAAGGSPTVAVGTGVDPDLYMDETDSDLSEVGTYTVTPLIDLGTTPADIVLTITPDSQTFTGSVYIVYSNPS